jgi:hypothetical protein
VYGQDGDAFDLLILHSTSCLTILNTYKICWHPQQSQETCIKFLFNARMSSSFSNNQAKPLLVNTMTKEVTFRMPPDSKSRSQKAFVRPHLKSWWEIGGEKRAKKKTIEARIKAEDNKKDEERPIPHYTPVWPPHRTSTIFQ